MTPQVGPRTERVNIILVELYYLYIIGQITWLGERLILKKTRAELNKLHMFA